LETTINDLEEGQKFIEPSVAYRISAVEAMWHNILVLTGDRIS